ncbi:MAG: hypothetical protein WCT52_01365 [Candidatus Micrarchaeia archaeon]
MKAPLAIAISILVFALVFSAGCIQPKPPAVNATEQPPIVTPQNNTSTPSEQLCSGGNVVQKDECFTSLAKATRDSEYCQNIYSIEKMDSCYALFANNSLDICKKITNAETKWGCLYANAVREKSDAPCKLIENDAARASCLQAVVPACMLIMDENARALCLALEKRDSSLCTNDWCFASYARNRSDLGACGGINAEFYRYACAAIIKDDVEICKQAAQSPVQDACIENVSIALERPSGCDLATPGSSYANRCYLHFALKYSDPTYCRKPYQEEQRDQCYSDYANLTANISTCPKIINTLNKIVCYRIAAIGNRMPSLCNDIGTNTNMRDCYAGSILYVDAGPVPSDCGNVADSDWKNKCYLRAAIKTNNATYCTFVGEGPDRQDCDELFGKK